MRKLSVLTFVVALAACGGSEDGPGALQDNDKGDIQDVVRWVEGIPRGAEIHEGASGLFLAWTDKEPGQWIGIKAFYRKGDLVSHQVNVRPAAEAQVEISAEIYRWKMNYLHSLVAEKTVIAEPDSFDGESVVAQPFSEYPIPEDGVYLIIATMSQGSSIFFQGGCWRNDPAADQSKACANCAEDPAICAGGTQCGQWLFDPTQKPDSCSSLHPCTCSFAEYSDKFIPHP